MKGDCNEIFFLFLILAGIMLATMARAHEGYYVLEAEHEIKTLPRNQVIETIYPLLRDKGLYDNMFRWELADDSYQVLHFEDLFRLLPRIAEERWAYDRFDCDDYVLATRAYMAQRYGINSIGWISNVLKTEDPLGAHIWSMVLYYNENGVYYAYWDPTWHVWTFGDVNYTDKSLDPIHGQKGADIRKAYSDVYAVRF